MSAKQAAAGFRPWIDGYYGLSPPAQLVQAALGSGEAQEPFDVFMYGIIPLPAAAPGRWLWCFLLLEIGFCHIVQAGLELQSRLHLQLSVLSLQCRQHPWFTTALSTARLSPFFVL